MSGVRIFLHPLNFIQLQTLSSSSEAIMIGATKLPYNARYPARDECNQPVHPDHLSNMMSILARLRQSCFWQYCRSAFNGHCWLMLEEIQYPLEIVLEMAFT
jgi:hypothetical protein